jgi:hypothetical protein
VRAGLIRVTRKKKPTLGQAIINGMTDNAFFPIAEITALLETLTKATDDLTIVNAAAETGNHTSIAAAKAAAIAFDNAVNAVIYYVQGKADAKPADAETMIKSAGLEVRKTPSPVPAPEAVKEIEAVYTNQPGNILVSWKMPKNASQSFVYMTTTPEIANSWVQINSMQGRKMMVANLTSGTRYYFRVEVANRRNEKSGLSDIASMVAA